MRLGNTQHSRLLIGAAISLTLSLFAMGCGSPVQGPAEVKINPKAFLAPSSDALLNQSEIEAAVVPRRDLVDLSRRFNDNPEVPYFANTPPIKYKEGDLASFWYKNHDTDENVQVDAVLGYRSDQLNLWFESGELGNDELLNDAAQKREEQILPTNRAFFGQEWQPGVDGDPRINILHLAELGGGTIGYFSQADEFVTMVNPYSNERELIYLSLKRAPVGSDQYYHVIAHEMQHMIHWNVDRNEDVWVNEGLSELASFLNGYSTPEYLESYAGNTDVQLNDFNYEDEVVEANYGASYLFFSYFLQEYGEDATRLLVSQPTNGIESIDQALAEIDPKKSFDDFFAQWLVVNYLDNESDSSSEFSYQTLELPEIEPVAKIRQVPSRSEEKVHQFGADYIHIRNSDPVTFIFTGTQQVRLIDTDAHSGEFVWSSFPADNSDMILTREIDLSDVSKATLNFWTWYELEDGWDYAYVTVSFDAGETWLPLETASTTTENPQGNSFGSAYTGISGGGAVPRWIEEKVNLTPFSGQKILLRFEVVTDDTVHGQGFAIDDVSIPELGLMDDFETDSEDWVSEGFVRHSNVLPQQFIVQAILHQDGKFIVRQLDLNADQTGQWSLPIGRDYDEAVIIIAGSTPVTNQPAGYRYLVVRPTSIGGYTH